MEYIHFKETQIRICGNHEGCDLSKAYKPRRYFIQPSPLEVLSTIGKSTLTKRVLNLRTSYANLWIQVSMMCISVKSIKYIIVLLLGLFGNNYRRSIISEGRSLLDREKAENSQKFQAPFSISMFMFRYPVSIFATMHRFINTDTEYRSTLNHIR